MLKALHVLTPHHAVPILFLETPKALLPQSLYHKVLIDLGKYEVETFNDPLMGNARDLLWFQSLVCLEFIFQLPFFVAALFYIGNATVTTYPDGFRAACIAYGAHTSTTLVPILSTFWAPDYNGTTPQRITLTAMYFPYLAIPAWLLWTAAMDGPLEKSKSS